MNRTKAQIKVQEMAFVLLALALLAILALVFFMRFQAENIAKSGELANQQRAISSIEKIAALQELSCPGEICVDKDKVSIINARYQNKLSSLFQGIKKVEIREIYPANQSLIVYQAGKGNQSYSTFISLCRQEKIGYSFDWNCSIALMEVSY